ncbi:class I SAM-dependent DNA methyltransferase [Ilumatobacter sp.]|uniref:class I SAM-dependent DNA methyltransferase n=1 Tax=Ilumatobacter sp. TaxID=1967498 RepID=UPI003AF8FBC8
MDGYDDTTYGDAFADVYDEWYEGISDIDSTVTTLLDLAGAGPVLELGVGTGRLAVPLAAAGASDRVSVSGIDTSEAMLDRLAARDPDRLVTATIGNMTGPLPAGPFELVFVAYNTLFNLTEGDLQARCFATVAEVLAPGGRFVVEAFVPSEAGASDSEVSVKSLTADRVVLSVSVQRPDRHVAEGQFVEITEAGGVRLRPWSIRYSSPAELDDMAAAAGLAVEHRWESFGRDPFTDDSERHVTVYRRV